jgi:hypothetical protein
VAKPLVLQLGDLELAMNLNKIDTSKLYGYKEVEVLDEKERTCELATLADDGRTIVGRGGTGIGYISADGHWCDRSELQPVDVEGAEIEPVASSFSAPIKLFETATYDEYLQHNVRLVYQLQTDDDTSDLLRELERGTIFTFPYSYRGGLEADTGFLLMGEDGNVFLAVGNPTDVEFVGLQQTAAVVEEDADTEESDLMDFDMI